MSSHPLHHFAYCPHCGAAHFAPDGPKSKRCASCGFVYYINPSSACVAFITDPAGQLLVATRATEPARGTWDLPGGFCDLYESIEEALLREVAEETSIDLRTSPDLLLAPPRYLFSIPNQYPYAGFVVHTMDAFYHLPVVSLSPFVGEGHDDVADLQAVPLTSLSPEHFGLRSIAQGVTRFLSLSLQFPQ